MKNKHFVLKILLAQVLLMVCASIASAQYTTLLGYTNQTWRYNDTSTAASNPQGLFQAPGFDDSVAGWKTGFPLFGNDDNGVYNSATQPFRGGVNGFATPLDRSGNRVTFYFRTHINVTAPINAGATLFSTNYLDDGAVFYINGVDVGRTRVPTGDLQWSTTGSNPATEGAPTRIDMPATALVQGDNVIAVEVHQSAATSSDVAFAMNLILINPFCVQILDPAQPADASVLENRSFTLSAVADASPPISYQWVHDDVDIVGATTKRYSVTNAQVSDGGRYYCRVSNPVCTVNSRTNTVTVTRDLVAPELVGAASGTPTTITVQFSEAMGDLVLDNFNWSVVDEGGNGVFLSDAIGLSADRSIVTLTLLEGTLQQDALYTVHVNDVGDLATNILGSADYQFRTFTTAGCNSFLFEAFDTSAVAGNAVSILTSSTNFPNNPRDVGRIPSFDSRNTGAYPDDTHNEFGGRVRGLFVPTVSGPWTFYLASDDNSELWLNPTGPSSAGKQLIARELNCCNNFLPEIADIETGARNTQTSVPINLTAGQAYYIEGLYKEGTGGDWLKVAARPTGEPVPVGGNSEVGSVGANSLPAIGGPAGILSFVTISGQPGNQTVIAGQPATFTVTLSSDVPACYQWKKNGSDIPGANSARYRFSPTPADDNTRYSVQVSLLGGTVLDSTEGLLRVSNDTTPPTALAASTDPYGTNVTVVFSENMDPTSVQNAANYQINGGAIAITAVTVVNPTTVRLALAQALAGCTTHNVRISAVQDQFFNTISPNPTDVSFLAPLLLVPLDAVYQWRFEDTGTDLGTSWREAAFNDGAWSQGPSVLAFETAALAEPIRTTLRDPRLYAPSPGSAVYFRGHFNLPADPSNLTSLRIRYLVDDGMVVYINGTEVHRQSVPTGEIYSTFATRTIGDATVYEGPFDIPTSALVFGDNVIAVSVHQVNATSSDTVFGLELTGAASSCGNPRPRLTITRNGNQATITSTAPAGTIYRASSLAGPWNTVGAAPQTVTIGPGDSFFEIR